MPKKVSITFPRSSEIKRAIATVEKAGIVIGSIEFSPTGKLRIFAAGSEPADAANDFDAWDKRGAL